MIEKISVKIVEKVNKQKQTKTYEITKKSLPQEKLEKLKSEILKIVEPNQRILEVKEKSKRRGKE